MARKIIIFFFAVISLSFSAYYFFDNHYSIYGNKIETVLIDGTKLKVETVDTADKRERGLGGRAGICASCGMLFEFPQKGVYSFWMKDMKFNLDILWISGGTVVKIAKNVPYSDGTSRPLIPAMRSDKVLEINAGLSDRIGIKIGDKIFF